MCFLPAGETSQRNFQLILVLLQNVESFFMWFVYQKTIERAGVCSSSFVVPADDGLVLLVSFLLQRASVSAKIVHGHNEILYQWRKLIKDSEGLGHLMDAEESRPQSFKCSSETVWEENPWSHLCQSFRPKLLFVFELPGHKRVKVCNQTVMKSNSIRKQQQNNYFFSFLLEKNSGNMSLVSRTKTFIDTWFLVSVFVVISAKDIRISTFPRSSWFNLSWYNRVSCL